mgnify:FL=1
MGGCGSKYMKCSFYIDNPTDFPVRVNIVKKSFKGIPKDEKIDQDGVADEYYVMPTKTEFLACDPGVFIILTQGRKRCVIPFPSAVTSIQIDLIENDIELQSALIRDQAGAVYQSISKFFDHTKA